jgi:hypothetical protein
MALNDTYRGAKECRLLGEERKSLRAFYSPRIRRVWSILISSAKLVRDRTTVRRTGVCRQALRRRAACRQRSSRSIRDGRDIFFPEAGILACLEIFLKAR